jgi:hypothetical protein
MKINAKKVTHFLGYLSPLNLRRYGRFLIQIGKEKENEKALEVEKELNQIRDFLAAIALEMKEDGKYEITVQKAAKCKRK